MLAAFVARPRGWTQSNASAGGGALAGLVGGTIGGKKQEKNMAAAEESGFELEVGAGANAKGAAEAFERAKAQVAAAGPSAG